jgi:hypothetical protein
MKNKITRRQFLATAAVSTGGIIAADPFQLLAQENPDAWIVGKQINPAIDNLRVVNCIDPAMINSDPHSWDFPSQNNPVVADKVMRNMDAMACALAQKNIPAEAWATIFMKPTGKQWSDVKVAVKLNCLGKNNPRVAVVASVANALIRLGVSPAHIMLYDGTGDTTNMFAGFIGRELPAGILTGVKNEKLGGMTSIEIPKPHKGTFKCTAAIANGEYDILVNIAVNKGHTIAGATLTLKNHAGTFEPMPIHFGGGLEYIIAFNKSKAILGGTPVRQQLCIVDSLWAMTKGPFGIPNKRPTALSMGVFGPAVDYIVARQIREKIMGCKHPDSLKKIMTEFGYADLDNLDFVTVSPV